ncbi:MAG: hypothetical protein ACYDB7_10290 [Mycobacteriales bacterium]
MFPDAPLLAELTRLLRHRFAALRRGDDGYSTEAVVVIALLVAMAITAVAIIAAKVLATAKGISTG